MGWGFRKSFSAGGVRYTFSKSGVSTSVGGKGYRFTSGPRGVYVTTGAGGFYYRQRIAGPRRRSGGRLRPTEEQVSGRWSSVESAEVEALTSVDEQGFVDALVETTSRRAVLVTAYCACALSAVAVWYARPAPLVLAEISAYIAVALVLATRVQNKLRSFLLVYDLSSGVMAEYDGMCSKLDDLGSIGSLRSVAGAVDHNDWKRHAGSTRALKLDDAKVEIGLPRHVTSNVCAWVLRAQGRRFFLLPDKLLVEQSGKLAAVSYRDLSVDVHTAPFVMDTAVPYDAEVIGETWKYVRKDGGPDRRFSGNHRLAVVRMAYLQIRSQTGINILLQVSSEAFASAAAAALKHYAQRDATSVLNSQDETLSEEVRRAAGVFGMARIPPSDEVRAAYRSLALRNHPDRFANAPPEVQQFALERMKEINEAYETLMAVASTVKHTAEDAVLPTVLASTSADKPGDGQTTWMGAATSGRRSVATAATMVAATFLLFRALPYAEVPHALMGWTNTATVEGARREPVRGARIRHPCNLRASQSTTSDILAGLPEGAEVTVLQDSGAWLRVRASNGTEGWTSVVCWR